VNAKEKKREGLRGGRQKGEVRFGKEADEVVQISPGLLFVALLRHTIAMYWRVIQVETLDKASTYLARRAVCQDAGIMHIWRTLRVPSEVKKALVFSSIRRIPVPLTASEAVDRSLSAMHETMSGCQYNEH